MRRKVIETDLCMNLSIHACWGNCFNVEIQSKPQEFELCCHFKQPEYTFHFSFFFIVMLEIKPRPLCMLGEHNSGVEPLSSSFWNVHFTTSASPAHSLL